MKEPIGVTLIVPAGQSAMPVYVDPNGIETFETDDSYLLSDGKSLESPLPVVDAGGPKWTDNLGNAVDAVGVTTITGGSTNPDPVPGPLDYVEEGEGLPSITVEYGLARPVAMMGIAFRHTGAITSLTATHGGEPLSLISFVLNPDENIGAAAFVGNGLTIEPADLVITPVGGTIGPAVVRIDDSFMIDEVEVEISDSVTGSSYIGSAIQPEPVYFEPVSGNGWGVYALAVAGSEQPSYAIGLDGAEPAEVLFGAAATSGSLKTVPEFSPNSTWRKDGEWWTHDGSFAHSHLIGNALPDLMGNPFWWEIEVDIPAGARIHVQTIGTGSIYLSESFIGPVSGIFRRYRHQPYEAKKFQIQGNGAARFRNFQYCDNGQTIYGAFGRTTNKVPNGSALQFQIGRQSRYAGVIAEVKEVE